MLWIFLDLFTSSRKYLSVIVLRFSFNNETFRQRYLCLHFEYHEISKIFGTDSETRIGQINPWLDRYTKHSYEQL